VFVAVVVYFVIDSVRKLLVTPLEVGKVGDLKSLSHTTRLVGWKTDTDKGKGECKVILVLT
jgi:hypothetical protein